ncbi:hypothetical protein LAZ67_9003853 [Cordylochernes scorpioides]|uniref:Uncharacterized protein n=1 Tax=Cordylochernes scorpioides TaxID=51811 RepID=A0ABY6KUT3_9ARAC|nr:hypothetical protein LAZ67_9003853 [Cordylochernes scorpioides]
MEDKLLLIGGHAVKKTYYIVKQSWIYMVVLGMLEEMFTQERGVQSWCRICLVCSEGGRRGGTDSHQGVPRPHGSLPMYRLQQRAAGCVPQDLRRGHMYVLHLSRCHNFMSTEFEPRFEKLVLKYFIY